MAAITKTTSVLNVNLADNADATTTFKLNNPIDNITLAQVQAVFAPVFKAFAIQANILINSSGNELVRIKSVEREQVVKTVEQIL